MNSGRERNMVSRGQSTCKCVGSWKKLVSERERMSRWGWSQAGAHLGFEVPWEVPAGFSGRSD